MAPPSRTGAPRAMIVLVLALGACGALGGCGGSASPTAPAAGRVFIDLLSSVPRSLDPAAEEGLAFDRLETSLASTLVRPAGRPAAGATLAPPDSVVGFLARSWKRLPSGDYLFDLRPNARSAYGHTVSAADVSFSFRRELASSATARVLARLARIALADPITVIARRRVRVNVTGPSPLALALLGNFRFAVLDASAVRAHESAGDPRARAWLSDHLAFYGAYQLTQFDPGTRLLLTATAHFRTPLAFNHLAIEAVHSSTMRLADIGAREASHTSDLDWASFQTATRTIGITAQAMASTTLSTLVPNERFRPFASVLVRRALSLAIDRVAISRVAFGGFAKPARHLEPSTIALPARVVEPLYSHNVALARRLLARAGYPRGFSFVLAASAGAGAEIPMELATITRELGAIGVEVSTRRVRSPADLSRLARDGRVGGVLSSMDAPIASVPVDIAINYLAQSPGNIEGYEDPSLDALAPSLTTTAPGTPANTAAQQRALRIVGTSYPVIALVEIPTQNVTLAQISGYAAYASPATYYDLLKG